MVRRPVLYATAAFAASIIVCYYMTPGIAFAVSSAMLILLFIKRERKSYMYIVIISALISIVNYQIHDMNESELLDLAGETHLLSGKVVSVEKKTYTGGQKYIQIKADIDRVDADVSEKPERILIKCNGYYEGDNNRSEISMPAPSDRLEALARIDVPQGKRNPGGFDYSLYLKSIGINVVATSVKTEIVPDGASPFALTERKLYLKKEAYLEQLAAEAGAETAAMMRAIMFGEKNELDEEMLEEFRHNGTAHILAVSGLHIGIIYKFLTILWPWRRRKVYFVFMMAFFSGYMFMASFSPSVVRAVSMIGLHIFAQIFNRRYDLSSAAHIVLLIMMFRNPMAIFNTGLQLSFLAVISMALFLPVIKKAYKGMFTGNIAIQAGMTPYLIYSFNYFSAAAVLINVPVVYIAGIIVPAGLCSMVIMDINDSIYLFLAGVISGLCEMLVRMNELVFSGGKTSVMICSPSTGFMCCCYLSIFFVFSEEGRLMVARKKKKLIIFIAAGIITASAVLGVITEDDVSDSELLFLDVGQGDAVHLRIRDGVFGPEGLLGTGLFVNEKNYLFDGGGSENYEVGKKILKPYLLKNGIKKLDGAFVTHMHSDHYNGIAELCREGMVDKLYLYEANRLKSRQIITETGLDENALVYLHQGNTVSFGKSCAEILWPERRTANEYRNMINNEDDENEMSMVIKIYHNGMSALITGDIDTELMGVLAEKYRNSRLLDSNILKVPHHGSGYSWDDAFIDAVSPEYAVIQVGKNNYGHPAAEIIKNYMDNRITVIRSDLQGAAGFRCEGGKVKSAVMCDGNSRQ